MSTQMDDDRKYLWFVWLFAGAFMCVAVVEGVRVGLGHTEDLRNYFLRMYFVVGCVFLAILYQTVREEESFKKFFAGLQVAIAAVLTFYQLGRLGETGWGQRDVVDRLMFLLGSIALLANGLKGYYAADEE